MYRAPSQLQPGHLAPSKQTASGAVIKRPAHLAWAQLNQQISVRPQPLCGVAAQNQRGVTEAATQNKTGTGVARGSSACSIHPLMCSQQWPSGGNLYSLRMNLR